MLNRFFLFIILWGGFINASGQDAQFSQYYAAPLYLNPGFTGSTEQHRVTANHRVQWPNLPHAFSSYAISYEQYDHKIKSGFGILATTDAIGSAGWKTTRVGLSYAFKAYLGKNWVFSPGLMFSYGVNGLDRSKLIMRDGLIHGDGNTYDPDIFRLDNSHYFDFSAGSVLYNSKWWFGLSAHHMNRPNISVIGDESELPMQLTAHAGVNILLYNGIRKIHNPHYITPSFIYRSTGGQYHQLDAGLRYHIEPLAFGLWYRGLSLSEDGKYYENEENIVQRDALVFITSIMFRGFQFGYSYDFSVSSERTSTGGAHEVSLSYEFKNNRKKSLKRNDKMIPCPTFLHGAGS